MTVTFFCDWGNIFNGSKTDAPGFLIISPGDFLKVLSVFFKFSHAIRSDWYISSNQDIVEVPFSKILIENSTPEGISLSEPFNMYPLEVIFIEFSALLDKKFFELKA